MSYTPASRRDGQIAEVLVSLVCPPLLAISPSPLLIPFRESSLETGKRLTGKSILQNVIVTLVMIEKIKNAHKHPFAQELKDVRVLGLIIFGIIVLMVSWSGVRVIETNYKLQREIALLQEQKELLELENANKKLEKEYYNTDQYLELQAREVFGKAAPGETVLVVPESVALANSKDLKVEYKTTAQAETSDKPTYQRNFEAWMRFLFRQSQS